MSPSPSPSTGQRSDADSGSAPDSDSGSVLSTEWLTKRFVAGAKKAAAGHGGVFILPIGEPDGPAAHGDLNSFRTCIELARAWCRETPALCEPYTTDWLVHKNLVKIDRRTLSIAYVVEIDASQHSPQALAATVDALYALGSSETLIGGLQVASVFVTLRRDATVNVPKKTVIGRCFVEATLTLTEPGDVVRGLPAMRLPGLVSFRINQGSLDLAAHLASAGVLPAELVAFGAATADQARLLIETLFSRTVALPYTALVLDETVGMPVASDTAWAVLYERYAKFLAWDRMLVARMRRPTAAFTSDSEHYPVDALYYLDPEYEHNRYGGDPDRRVNHHYAAWHPDEAPEAALGCTLRRDAQYDVVRVMGAAQSAARVPQADDPPVCLWSDPDWIEMNGTCQSILLPGPACFSYSGAVATLYVGSEEAAAVADYYLEKQTPRNLFDFALPVRRWYVEVSPEVLARGSAVSSTSLLDIHNGVVTSPYHAILDGYFPMWLTAVRLGLVDVAHGEFVGDESAADSILHIEMWNNFEAGGGGSMLPATDSPDKHGDAAAYERKYRKSVFPAAPFGGLTEPIWDFVLGRGRSVGSVPGVLVDGVPRYPERLVCGQKSLVVNWGGAHTSFGLYDHRHDNYENNHACAATCPPRTSLHRCRNLAQFRHWSMMRAGVDPGRLAPWATPSKLRVRVAERTCAKSPNRCFAGSAQGFVDALRKVLEPEFGITDVAVIDFGSGDIAGFSDAIRIGSEIDVLVGVSGAALLNQIWGPTNGLTWEMTVEQPPDEVGQHYFFNWHLTPGKCLGRRHSNRFYKAAMVSSLDLDQLAAHVASEVRAQIDRELSPLHRPEYGGVAKIEFSREGDLYGTPLRTWQI
ncbi:uncharacterized protein AMSG_06526 [Thecamonas trahens ATCC 50062]|uniref:Uncharacterized protein n=1 Tax=Thecamonas trahens ATCC 50062 TaxID=461836 RepID=A0A0L0DG65_THETB|nr:hypothetical protein AMSG_06526 [Thecamonas trahens ATCC 50062]KNC51175.1 hypothetical protein AMSG_06526 [Thecamonas trahens ATCC 50062]|eukprot:XP_013756377.1 hypothetical protein AMSG_06526 [Thecamonas trahens ATCC 50062]